MKKCRLRSVFVFTLVSLFLSGCAVCKIDHRAEPLAAAKISIQAKLDEGKTVSEALGAVITAAGTSTSDAVSAAIKMGLDTQAVVKAAITASGDPLTVGNSAYNAGANLHDIYMAGGSTSGGSTGLGSTPGNVEQPR
ncbi:MAG: hypothetical protein HON76_13725 [Candidatus Scalindua sp.]|jgi:hypothetical protein|nr:hypothetical protein [Candidatus Scalindua sp.]MBT6049632.1 hypothetical protein [Candidatus Scalindua sp.]MBT6226709.1 hypothetical protein [Candidatus Scalindua sp.]MBT6563576.1 hypothetical protein [Candidatus Scalindua sp.]MBT7211081.1 hypothetical protein [Candidatus Scalindua sp.]